MQPSVTGWGRPGGRIACISFYRFVGKAAGRRRDPGQQANRETLRRRQYGGRPRSSGSSTVRGFSDAGFGRRTLYLAGRAVVSRGRRLKVVLAGVALGALSALPAGCGFGGAEQITLVYLTWDENIAVSNLTKVLLEEELGYENVELRRAPNVGPVYKMLANAKADAFQDTWMPNQKAELAKVQDEVDLLDPWFKGTTRFSVATPGYMHLSSIGQLNDTGAEYIIGIESESRMMQKLPQDVIPEYGLKQQLIQADTEAMLAEVEKRYRAREEFAFLAWSPHWMNLRFDIRYLEDPKDAMGETNDPAECSTIVREDLREEDPAAYALMDALAINEDQINGLEQAINEEGDPLAGARRWASENRGVVRPWIEAARNAGEEQ